MEIKISFSRHKLDLPQILSITSLAPLLEVAAARFLSPPPIIFPRSPYRPELHDCPFAPPVTAATATRPGSPQPPPPPPPDVITGAFSTIDAFGAQLLEGMIKQMIDALERDPAHLRELLEKGLATLRAQFRTSDAPQPPRD